jgi:hypothetical protein
MNTGKVKQLARDLRKTPPRSPRDTLGGFVIAARMLDKARADLLGINGEYNFYPCGLGAYFWKFTGLDAMKFKEFVASGATDEQVDHWIRENTTQKDPTAVLTGITRCVACGFVTSRNRSRSILRLIFRSFVIRQVK